VLKHAESPTDGFPRHAYGRRTGLVLLNGLAEQPETWFRNQAYWQRYFDVHMPRLLAYDGDVLQERIDAGRPVNVPYLVERLRYYLDQFVQSPPYHLVASSLGGKIAIEYAATYPNNVRRMVLLCPSGLGEHERLPLVDGTRWSQPRSLIDKVFWNPECVDPALVHYYEQQWGKRRWRRGLLATIQGTKDHDVRRRLPEVPHPTLIIGGPEDQIVDPACTEAATRLLPRGRFLMLLRCGHAPQVERPRLINRLVVRFLSKAAARSNQR